MDIKTLIYAIWNGSEEFSFYALHVSELHLHFYSPIGVIAFKQRKAVKFICIFAMVFYLDC